MSLLEDIRELQETPWLKSRLSFGFVAMNESFQFLLDTLSNHRAKPSDVMQQYKDGIRWPIPARYSELPFQENFLPRLPTTLGVKELQNLFNECLAFVLQKGYTGKALYLMEDAFGNLAFNPMLFSFFKPSEAAGKIFSVEFALAISNYRGVLNVEGDGCYMRLRGRQGTSLPIGLYNLKTRYKRPDWLRVLLFEPRAYLRYNTFDSADRLLLWSRENLSGLEQAEFDHILFTLKTSNSDVMRARVEKLAHRFEIEYEDMEVIDPFQALLYTDEALVQVKSIWLEGEGPSYATYREMYEYLVPTYFDAKQWQKLFQVGDIKEKNFFYSDVETIDSRFDVFTAFFDKTKAKIERKK